MIAEFSKGIISKLVSCDLTENYETIDIQLRANIIPCPSAIYLQQLHKYQNGFLSPHHYTKCDYSSSRS